MWKQFLEIGKQIFGLMRKTQQHDEDIRALRQEISEINQKLDELTDMVTWLAVQRERDRELVVRDRENLLLRLENNLLRFERRLPPGSQGAEPPEA